MLRSAIFNFYIIQFEVKENMGSMIEHLTDDPSL